MHLKCRKCRFRDPKFKLFPGSTPTNVLSLFNNVSQSREAKGYIWQNRRTLKVKYHL